MRGGASISLVMITVTGVLNEGDEDTFRHAAASSSEAVVVLDSEGGVVKPL